MTRLWPGNWTVATYRPSDPLAYHRPQATPCTESVFPSISQQRKALIKRQRKREDTHPFLTSPPVHTWRPFLRHRLHRHGPSAPAPVRGYRYSSSRLPLWRSASCLVLPKQQQQVTTPMNWLLSCFTVTVKTSHISDELATVLFYRYSKKQSHQYPMNWLPSCFTVTVKTSHISDELATVLFYRYSKNQSHQYPMNWLPSCFTVTVITGYRSDKMAPVLIYRYSNSHIPLDLWVKITVMVKQSCQNPESQASLVSDRTTLCVSPVFSAHAVTGPQPALRPLVGTDLLKPCFSDVVSVWILLGETSSVFMLEAQALEIFHD